MEIGNSASKKDRPLREQSAFDAFQGLKSAAGVADASAVAAAEEENDKNDDNPAAVASTKSTVAVHKKTLL